jgi:hypothetical protein
MRPARRAAAGAFALALAAVAAQAESTAVEAATAPASTPASETPKLPASDRARPSPGLHGLETATRRADGALVIRGKLSGNGTVPGTGTRVITGAVSPGNSPGCVSDQGNVVFDGSGSLVIELGGTAACTQFDQYSVALSLTLNGPTLNVLLINGFVPAAGQRFKVLSWGTLVGTFGQVALPALPVGLNWDTTALYTTGELAVNGPAADVPLPAWSIGLLGGSLMALLARRRKH